MKAKRFILIISIIGVVFLSSCGTKNKNASINSPEACSSEETDSEEIISDSCLQPYTSFTFDSNIESLINGNAIDKAFLKEMNAADSTVEQLNVLSKYYTVWIDTADKLLCKLERVMPDKQLELLKSSQQLWEAYTDDSAQLMRDVYETKEGYGTVESIMYSYGVINKVRLRAFELEEYLYIISNKVEF